MTSEVDLQIPLTLRFRVGPFPVRVLPTFWISALALGWDGSWRFALLFAATSFVCVLVHELGHAVTARNFGANASIVLYSLGGVARHDALPREAFRVVTLAGPAAGFAVGAFAYLVHPLVGPGWPWLITGLRCVEWSALGWGLINLLPVLPLDGGQFFGALLPRSRRPLVALMGLATSVVAVIAGLLVGWKSVAYLFSVLALSNLLIWRHERSRGGRVTSPTPEPVLTVNRLREVSTAVLEELEVLRGETRRE